MANLNIFGSDWSNIVFEGRNKNYGGYKLRKENTKNTLTALLIGLAIIGTAFCSKYIYDSYFGEFFKKQKDDEGVVMEEVILPDLPEPEPPVEEIKEEPKPEPEQPEQKPEPEKADASKSVIDEKKFTETVVKKDEEVNKDKLQRTAQKDFDDNTTSGRDDNKGDKKAGDLKTDGNQTGKADKGSQGTGKGDKFSEEQNDNRVYSAVTDKAVPLIGFDKWGAKFQREFRTPSNIPSNVQEIVLNLMFVVEKDGSVSDVRVLGDKYGLTKEVERTLSSLGKWKPAEQNGVKVRYSFRQTLRIRDRKSVV